MRILILSAFNNEKFGGGEVVAWQVASGLSQRGHTVNLVSGQTTAETQTPCVVSESYRGLPIKRFSLPANHRNDKTVLYDPWLDNLVRETLNSAVPDLVYVNELHVYSASVIDEIVSQRIPVVFMAHDFWPMCKRIFRVFPSGEPCLDGPGSGFSCSSCSHMPSQNNFLTRLAAFRHFLMGKTVGQLIGELPINRALLRNAYMLDRMNRVSAFLAVSDFQAREYIKWGVHPNLVKVVKPGVFMPSTPLDHPHSDYKPLTLLYFGRVNRTKGIHVLIKAMEELHADPVHLHIVGDTNGAVEESWRGMPNLTFHGHLDRAGICRVAQLCHLAVVPSVVVESSPLSIREAFSLGLPVIASCIGGIPELVRDRMDGILTAPGDVASLVRAVRAIVQKPATIDELRRNLQPQRSVDTFVKEIESLFDELVAKRLK